MKQLQNNPKYSMDEFSATADGIRQLSSMIVSLNASNPQYVNSTPAQVKASMDGNGMAYFAQLQAFQTSIKSQLTQLNNITGLSLTVDQILACNPTNSSALAVANKIPQCIKAAASSAPISGSVSMLVIFIVFACVIAVVYMLRASKKNSVV
jgi:hypothetical protein